jgi:membrane fusion protein, adhesin transport system
MRFFDKDRKEERLEPEIPEEDLNFITDANAAILANTPKGGRVILLAAAAFITTMLSWASIAEIDEVTKGEGKVIPSSQVQIVQNLEGGILSEILVKEGQTVSKDQVLLRIDDTRFSSSLRESRLQILAMMAKAARLKAEADGETKFTLPPEVVKEAPKLGNQEQSLFESRLRELKASTDILTQQVTQRKQEVAELRAKEKHLTISHANARKELNLKRPLANKGAISPVEILQVESRVAELQGELEATRLAIPRVQSTLKEARQKVEEAKLRFRNEARAQYNEVAPELERISESSVALEDRVRRTSVRSPVRGTVKQLLINTVGGVIQPGAELVEIVPLEDTLLIETKIRPQDIAFLRPGQEATIKFTAYDFAIYGGLTAKVEHISADTIADEKGDSYYQVRLRTEKNFLGSETKPLPIIPGMVAEVDVLTGKKTILDYLLKPVLRAKDRALSER